MEAFVSDFGDYVIVMTFREFESWNEKAPLQGKLLFTGEKPSGKKIILRYNPNLTAEMELELDGDGWDKAKVITITCSQKIYARLDSDCIKDTELMVGTARVLILLQGNACWDGKSVDSRRILRDSISANQLQLDAAPLDPGSKKRLQREIDEEKTQLKQLNAEKRKQKQKKLEEIRLKANQALKPKTKKQIQKTKGGEKSV